jgi:membrane protease YdiL (CAAX protease family)
MDIELKSKIKMKLKIVGRILVFTFICFFFMAILGVLLYYYIIPIMMPTASRTLVMMFDAEVSLISVLCATKICMYFFEKKKMIDIGLRFSIKSKRELLLGIIIPFIMLLIVFLFYIVFGFGYIVEGSSTFVFDLFLAFLVFVLVAFNEEIMFRGYIFQKFIELTNKYFAAFLLSFLFGLAHLGNPNISILGVINIVLVGILFSICYIKTSSLWLPISLHFSWNFVQGSVFGFPVSGFNNFDTFILFVSTGPEWVTGGSFGPEGGIIASLLLLAITSLILFNKKLFPVLQSNQELI